MISRSKSRSYALALFLALSGIVAGVGCSFYSAKILKADSAAAAAPFAAPFALLALSAAAAVTLSAVAICDEL